jgi:integrase
VTVPGAIMPRVIAHLDAFVGGDKDALLFVGPKGGPLRRSNFQHQWVKATAAAGVRGIHFHDLRHTGNTWAAETGATLRDLMDRMGHATTRAALIYLHKSAGRDRAIADALSKMLERSRLKSPTTKTRTKRRKTQGARRGHDARTEIQDKEAQARR